ncbi:MAG TPA: lysylphosphatidylglycerol synthase transmembrane domain-containing protein, partial [Thermoanaerobaculia bacterium]|nr:lysylphosphatidylglycerol synthase transmembrane domain-containing protein [Thermoanaerobaculia bacterium]
AEADTTAEPALPADEAPAAAGSPRRAAGFDRLGRRLLVPAALALLALVGLALFADARQLAAAVAGFDPRLLVPVLALSLVNYGLRFARWQLYLGHLGSRLPAGASLGVFLVGFLLSVTPGKAGELGKAWLVRALGGGRALPAVSAVLAERVTDLLAVVLLVSLGALALPGGGWVCLAGVAAVAAVVLLLSPGLLAAGLALAAAAWGAEGVGFWLVVGDYAPGAELARSVFDYSASTLAGALSMLPGGLLATEGSLAALLDAQGLGNAAAASATLISRAATLWFAVALGLAALPWVLRAVRRHGTD